MREVDSDHGLRIRWMIRRDLPDVLEIERASSASPWDEDAFVNALHGADVVCLVAEFGDRIVGHLVYIKFDKRFNILNFAVAKAYRKMGIGRAMFQRVVRDLSIPRCDEIEVRVLERNLGAQLFFRRMGMTAMQVAAVPDAETDEDVYVFSYVHRPER